MKKLLLIIVSLVLGPLVNGQNVFDCIMSNIRSVQWENIQSAISLDFKSSDISSYELLDKDVRNIHARQEIDGHWDDIDYRLHTQTAWLPTQHLVRLHKMVLAYTLPGGALEGDRALYLAIRRGLQYWYDQDPRSTNWWYQQIYCPKQIGEMLILLRAGKMPLDRNLEDSLLARMALVGGEPDGRYSKGSANRVNISSHWIYRGCLTRNLPVLEAGVKNALLPVRFNAPAEGVQPDYSYQEHGNQLYIGNYGYAFVDNIASMARYLRNTRYALSGEQLSLFSHFVRYTYLPAIRGRYYSFSIPGRQVANKDNLDRSKTTEIMDRMQLIDPAYAAVYRAASARWSGKATARFGITPAHTHYWLSDYTAHIRPGYFFDVRFVSRRTVRTENINSEDKKGFFLADGATNMTVKGDEYFNVFGVWDWCKVPGVTAPQYDSLPDMRVDVGGDAGTTSFCGGVTDSLYGASCYDMDYARFRTKARKSWFFFDKAIVCLGAGIRSDDKYPVATTVNQCLSKGTVSANGKALGISSTEYTLSRKKDNWVLHNGFGYYFPEKANIAVANKIQYGNWRSISVSQADERVADRVFSLWINHGVKPVDGRYAYVVLPGVSNSAQLNAIIRKKDVIILENTEQVQAVFQQTSQLLEAVFYEERKALAFGDQWKISVDNPCALLLQKVKGDWVLHVSDPSQALKEITVLLENTQANTLSRTTIILPQGTRAGSSVKYVFKK